MADVMFDQGYFDELYRKNPDPWAFRSSAYEKAKYAATLAALPRARYGHILELGSSIGELTAMLAGAAARVTGVETSPVAIASARARCAPWANVDFVQAHLPHGDWMPEADGVVLSEVLYYLQADEVDILAARLAQCLPAADFVLVHWTGETNYPLTGDEASERFGACFPAHAAHTVRTPFYRLDTLYARSRTT